MMRSLLLILQSAGLLYATAEPYAVDWHAVSNGGGTSTGGVYAVCGTIGRSDAGHLAGGNYSVDGGFWGFFATTQTPGAPVLTIKPSGSEVAIFWPSSAVGFVLQQNNDLANVNGWLPVAGTIADNGSTKRFTIRISSGTRFYRLLNP